MTGGRRAAAARDAVGLLHESDAHPQRQRGVGCRYEVARRDAAAGAVTQDERRGGSGGTVQMGLRVAVSGLDPDGSRHAADRTSDRLARL